MNCLISCINSHNKQNAYSQCMALTKRDPPALDGRLARSLIRCFSFTPSSVWQSSQFLLPVSSLALCVPLTASHLPSLALSSPPLLPLVDFFPLRSSLQRGEKHTCQIQVGHHTVSHPHQLLSTRRFDANRFFSIVKPKRSSFFLGQDGKGNSCSVSMSMWQSSLGASMMLFRPVSQKGDLLETAPHPPHL